MERHREKTTEVNDRKTNKSMTTCRCNPRIHSLQRHQEVRMRHLKSFLKGVTRLCRHPDVNRHLCCLSAAKNGTAKLWTTNKMNLIETGRETAIQWTPRASEGVPTTRTLLRPLQSADFDPYAPFSRYIPTTYVATTRTEPSVASAYLHTARPWRTGAAAGPKQLDLVLRSGRRSPVTHTCTGVLLCSPPRCPCGPRDLEEPRSPDAQVFSKNAFPPSPRPHGRSE